MAVVKNHVSVMDGPNQAGVFSDRVVAAQQLGVANASGTNPATVVTFSEPLPAAYTVLVSLSQGLPWFVNNKTAFGFTVNIVGAAAAGTFDVTVLAL